ncbi:FAD-binding domain-containing protein [Cognatishimia sp. F0-27]|uniref:FAD-binding domain-containing protein n=1 Tax=Cognatishimia sp. F0-27 TaxID=2816855 RepID=UPI001D0C6D80
MSDFSPTRADGLARLARFVPKAGKTYASKRNYDRGPGGHEFVSTLSPYLRHRIVTEAEVIDAVLGRHTRNGAEKFIQEVLWRTYWKGWLEMRPQVWTRYQSDLRRALDAVQTQSGLRRNWEAACTGQTGIEPFDHWAQELVDTGYLHNHARMWFASIWVFTLRLPWELGADFFLRHLLDGDPASNTLGWRWVAGLQTRGKTYLARPSNIEKFTEGRFSLPETSLAPDAPPVQGPDLPPRMAAPQSDSVDPSKPTAFVLHEDDLSPGWILDKSITPLGTALVTPSERLTPLTMAPQVLAFREAATREAAERWKDRLGPVATGLSDGAAIAAWARDLGAEQIVTARAPVGAVSEVLSEMAGIPVLQPMRTLDQVAWPHATAGFFKFREKIPQIIGALQGLRAA